ncbi:protein kinase domain-containing protein [Gemmatimonas sp.]|uniref:protein kinase domain-containing protein n=1 Tax=Gemmatimonas sp. TaxID=1962908 RepID=UPI0039838DDB
MTPRPELTAALGERYVLMREVGVGGMANVYLAKDTRHHRQVAVKVLRAELASSLGADRFLREITIAAGLQHPNILPLFDSGGSGDVLYYVMPFVDGESLRDRLTRGGALPVDDAIRFLRDVADALAHAHRRGLIHRDIKPENIMLADGHALVTDFGIAKAVSDAAPDAALTATGLAMGTPAYMAPEQAMADAGLDHRVDLYAFGVMAYEMLAGHAPFSGSSAQQIVAAHLTRTPEAIAAVRPNVPAALAQLVMRCLEKSPADRVQSADEILRIIDSMSAGSTGTVAASAGSATNASTRARRGLRFAAGIALVATAVGATIYTKVGRAGTLIGNNALAEHDIVLVAEFQNRTTDSTLSATVTDAVRTELQQSRAVEVMSQQATWAALTRMELARGTALPENAVRELAEREGAKAYIVGDVARLGGGYQISARVVATREGSEALTARATAASDAELIGAVEQIGRELRRRIGESLRSVAASTPLAQVTTASLPALRLYTTAARAETNGERPKAIAMATQAIALDTAFASAWSLLAVIYSNIGQVSGATDATKRAYALRNRMSDVQRLSTEARYHKIMGDAPAEEAAWSSLAESGSASAFSNFANFLAEHGRVAESEIMARRAVSADSTSSIALWNLAEAQVAQHRFAAAESTAALARARIPSNNYRYSIELSILFAKRDLDSLTRYLASPTAPPLAVQTEVNCLLDLQRGRVQRWRSCRSGKGPFVRQELMLVLAEYRLTSDSVRALASLQPFLTSALKDRDVDSYSGVIAVLADVGRVSDARRLLDEWRARGGASDPSFRADSSLALGAIAAAEQNWERAASLFLAWNRTPAVSAAHWYNRGFPEAAEMMRRAGKPDSAIALGERALASSSTAYGYYYEPSWYAPLLESLGDLHAERGNRAKAAEYYRAYLQLMKDAEAPVTTQVAGVRERLAKVTGEPVR